jgi:hypothetical protein
LTGSECKSDEDFLILYINLEISHGVTALRKHEDGMSARTLARGEIFDGGI